MVRILPTLAVLSAVLLVTTAAPVRYDQRQEGELNVMAHLQNIVFVFIPTSSNVVPNLLNLATNVYKGAQSPSSEEGKASSVEPHETKSYSVEVIAIKEEEAPKQSPLAKLHPDPAPGNAEVLVAQSPSVALSKVPEKVATPDPSFVIPASEAAQSIPAAESPKPEQVKAPEKADAIPPTPVKVKTAKVIVFSEEIPTISSRKMAEVHDKDQSKVKLLSAGLEECAPDQRRNSQGLCQQIKPRERSGQYFPLDHLLPALRFGLSPAD